ncbi:LamG-like jellyroll fold domain-containing protein [Portibacter marinus]|uniref:LamG-like jellyroll fold domain-containing protein n=1 Tax=Portibacter marinus TaxID=2898660 RepID=UPI001F1C9BD0|nr:LamG-like jellyroll fold domain-containing protein [Portibacter marinus]
MRKILPFLALLIFTGLYAQDLEEGLVMHYPLDGNLTDTISGITAENNGNLTFEEGIKGGAVRYFNQDAYFVTPEGKLQVGPAADGGTAGTFALYVNHRAAPLETDRQNYLAQKNGCGPEDNNRGRVVLYRQNPNNESDPDSIISFLTGRPLRTNYKLDEADTWIHLCLTVDPEIREWAFFVNGQETRRDTFTGDTQVENSCGEFVVGHHLTFTNENQTFDGLMDDLRFYNRVLSQEEIDMLVVGSSSVKNELVDRSIKFAPNPASTHQPIEITLDPSEFQSGDGLEISIMNANGQRVLNRRFDSFRSKLTLDHDLSAGFYSVTISDGQNSSINKLIIQ